MDHADLPFSHGGFIGIDVFCVLSGFLITGLILKEVERTGSFSLLGFYARRAKRILPLAATVLFAVTIAGLLVFSVLRRDQLADEITAAGLYVSNWYFAAQHVDYFNAEAVNVSPVQHYWFLSLEEQFYLTYPVALALAAAWAARTRLALRQAALVLVVPVVLGSLAYTIWFTGVDQQVAYFSTFTRAWEFAAGGVLAMLMPAAIRLRAPASTLLASGGLLVLLATTATFSGSTPYPGWRVMLPVFATVGIIVAGTAVTASRPTRLLTLEPFQYLGRISYAWYLWHWPVIIFGIELLDTESVPTLVLLTLLAWIPAQISYRLIEEPLRRSTKLRRRPRQALVLGVACTLAAVAFGVTLRVSEPTIETASIGDAPGAAAYRDGIQTAASALRPDPRNAVEDWGALIGDHCQDHTEPDSCVYGDPASKKTVVLWGDSHAAQYFPALEALARKHDWRLVGLVHAKCNLADLRFDSGCAEWRDRALARIREEKPALVVVSNATLGYAVKVNGTTLDETGTERALEAGLARTLRTLKDTGAKVALIRDQARAPSPPVECVADSLQSLDQCAFKPKRSEQPSYDFRAAQRVGGVRVVDPMPLLCPASADGLCPEVMGNVLVYRDQYHLTANFSRTLAPWLGRKLRSLFSSDQGKG
jgi:peptidoglycan/LPS O-acetylase OafA/YrhL